MSKIKRITILGGTGFLGQHLAARLSKQGYQLCLPTRNRESHRELLVLPGVELVQANPHDVQALRTVLEGSDALINLVGILNESRSAEQKFQSAHVDLTRQALDLCAELGITRYLHMSALKADPETAPSRYLKSKGAAEVLVQKSALQTTVFRPSVIFGEQDSFVNKFAGLLKLPSPVFFLPMPNARFAPVCVDDVVEALVRALEDRTTYNKRYSCCGPKIYSLRELIRLIANTLGLKRIIIGLGSMPSRLAASIMGLLPGKPFSKDNYLSLKVNSICEDNGLQALGITPQSMESVIPAYLKPRDTNALYSEFRRTAGRDD